MHKKSFRETACDGIFALCERLKIFEMPTGRAGDELRMWRVDGMKTLKKIAAELCEGGDLSAIAVEIDDDFSQYEYRLSLRWDLQQTNEFLHSRWKSKCVDLISRNGGVVVEYVKTWPEPRVTLCRFSINPRTAVIQLASHWLENIGVATVEEATLAKMIAAAMRHAEYSVDFRYGWKSQESEHLPQAISTDRIQKEA